MKTKIRGTNIVCSKEERTNKLTFISMRSKAAKIIVNARNSHFTILFSEESIVLQCD